MCRLLLVFPLSCLLLLSCKDENITNNYGPQDWRPPQVRWLAPPEAEIRGTVGLDVSITDSSAVPFALLYIDGTKQDSLISAPWRFEVVTDSLTDGIHLLEVRAQDAFANEGVSPILRANVMNGTPEGPRLIWVPDNFERIQDAINAAITGDTVRVRDGTYYETINLFGKGLWLESEHGPITCTIDGQHAQNTIFSIASDGYTCVRGFMLRHGGGIAVQFDDGCRFGFFNNIAFADSEDALLYARRTAGDVRNNMFVARFLCIEIWSLQGTVYNNILQNASVAAMWNTNYAWNPVEYGYNLFWQNVNDYYNFTPGEGDIHGDPLVDLGNGRLEPNSPAIDVGSPGIHDTDGTRSDIGPFGGPWAY